MSAMSFQAAVNEVEIATKHYTGSETETDPSL
jgi:hypothetical protein